MRQLILTTLLIFSAMLMAGAPLVVLGQDKAYRDAYVPCGNIDVKTFTREKDSKSGEIRVVEKTGPDGVVDNPCGFNDVIELARRLILGWIMGGVTIAALGFAYAGFLYITAMGSEEKISHAHSIFVKTFWGFVFMLSAWLIAKTMESVFLSDDMKAKSFLNSNRPSTVPAGGGTNPAGAGGGTNPGAGGGTNP